MKIVAFSDLHIHDYKPHNDDGGRLQECLDILGAVDSIAQEEKADAICFNGDLTEEGKHLDTALIKPITRLFEDMADDRPVFFITGNHDHKEKNVYGIDYSATTDILEDIEGVHTVDFKSNAFKGAKFTGLPFIRNTGDLDEALNKIATTFDDKFNILMLHNNPSTVSEKNEKIRFDFDIEHPAIQKADLVLCGHYHHSFIVEDKNFFMLGNPIHRKASDKDEEKYIWVFDIDVKTKEYTYKQIRSDKWARRFCYKDRARKTKHDISIKDKVKLEKKNSKHVQKYAKAVESGDYADVITQFGKDEKLSKDLIQYGLSFVK